jgi:hypothetical protein
MKVKINGKIFKTLPKEDNHFEIRKGLDMFDFMFFGEWFIKGNDIDSNTYREDIPFVSKVSHGKMLGCFPCEIGEDYVIFVYNQIQSKSSL